MRLLAVLALAAVLAGCASPAPEPPVTPAERPQTAEPVIPSRVEQKDQCGAVALAYLVGRPKSEIPVPVDPARRRVACLSCCRRHHGGTYHERFRLEVLKVR